MDAKPKSRGLYRALEVAGLLVLCAAIPFALTGLLLPVNEYSWMEHEGLRPSELPFDCDGLPLMGLLLVPPAILFLLGLVVFGYLLIRHRSRLRLFGALLSLLMIIAMGFKLPGYFRESVRSAEHCTRR